MNTWQLLLTAWNFEPTVLVGCAALAVVYMWVLRGRLAGTTSLLFIAGVLVLLIALVSPLDTLGDNYLFSVHMVQHLLLIVAVPPLLLTGTPAWVFDKLFSIPAIGKAARVLGHPVTAWTLGIGAMWIWHLPVLYDAALENENIHVVQHLSFLVTSTIFWWPVFAPPQYRMSALRNVAYLLAAGMASTGLGIILTFAPVGLYSAYLHPSDPLGVLPLIRDGWGLSVAADQQIGGLIMWVPGGLVYLCAMLAMLARWYAEPEPEDASVDVAGLPQTKGA